MFGEMNQSAAQPPEQIRFHFIKSNFFRVVHADGVFGGATPKGLLQMAFFSERFPIPLSVTHAVSPTSPDSVGIGKELQRETKDGVVREVEVEVIMNLSAALAFQEWLHGHIKQLRDGGAGRSPN